MYEKPQYLTPDGYRRNAKNPMSDSDALSARNALQLLRNRKKALMAGQRAPGKSGRGLSEEAARLIARAISGMLKSG